MWNMKTTYLRTKSKCRSIQNICLLNSLVVLYLRRTSEHQKESKGHKVIERCEAVPFPPMPVSLTGKSENFPTCVPTTKLISLWTTANVTFGTSALQILYGGQFTWSTQLLKPNYHVILSPPLPQNHSFLVVVVETEPLYQKTHLSMRVSTKLSTKETGGSIQPQVTTFII